MFNEKKEMTLSDLLDIELIQEIQDGFAQKNNIAALIVDDNGPITKPSNFIDFCQNHIRKNEIGNERCINSDIEGGKMALERGEPLIYNCHAGLLHFVVPIMVNGKHIASFLGGQFVFEPLPSEHLEAVADDIGIEKTQEFKEACKTIKIVPRENIEMGVALLSLIVNSIAKIAQEKYALAEKNKREELIGAIVKKIRSTLDSDAIKKYFIKITREYFDADRCFFFEYDVNSSKFLLCNYEDKKSKDIKSFLGSNLEDELPEFAAKFKKGRDVIIRDLDKTFLRGSCSLHQSLNVLKENNIKSDYAMRIKSAGELVGFLVVQFVGEKRILTRDEIKFLRTICEQAGIAISQAKLYESVKDKVKKEELLREITEFVRGSLDINATKQKIVDVIGAYSGVNRCFIIEYNKAHNRMMLVSDEYVSSENVLSCKGLNIEALIPSLASEVKQGQSLIFDGSKLLVGGKLVDLSSGKFDDLIKASEHYGASFALVLPLFYVDEYLGSLVLHFVDSDAKISDDKVEFLELLTKQIAVAIHQSRLYDKVKRQAEREKASRNIIEILRSTLDKDLIQNLFVKNIGKYFGADRVFFSEFDPKSEKYLPINSSSEFLSSDKEKSYTSQDLFRVELSDHFTPILQKREIIIPDWNAHLEKNYKSPEMIALYKEANVKSSYCFPVLYEGRAMGFFGIEFSQRITEFLNEDIIRLRNICSQAGIALYHSELYLRMQKSLREKGAIIEKVRKKIEKPVKEILNMTKILADVETEREKQTECLSNIIKSCNQLLELTKHIAD